MNSEDDINKKMDTVLEVLQKFGLNMITQIGGLKHNISVLTNQVEKLNDSMLNLKSIGVKLEKIFILPRQLSRTTIKTFGRDINETLEFSVYSNTGPG